MFLTVFSHRGHRKHRDIFFTTPAFAGAGSGHEVIFGIWSLVFSIWINLVEFGKKER